MDLVKPPNPADVSGLAVVVGTTPLATSDVTLDASGAATVVSNLAAGVDETNITFTDLRWPSSCPSPAANVTMTAVSQSGASVTTTAPLDVTGCSGLPYAPRLAVSEAKDAKNTGAALGLEITQAADEAASKTIVYKLPSGVGVNLPADRSCLSGAGCVVGTATATSPLAPVKLTGTVTLGGSATSPTVTASFPAPFALTLVGRVSAPCRHRHHHRRARRPADRPEAEHHGTKRTGGIDDDLRAVERHRNVHVSERRDEDRARRSP